MHGMFMFVIKGAGSDINQSGPFNEAAEGMRMFAFQGQVRSKKF